MNWYLLQTKPNNHAAACKHLKRQGFDVFLPLIEKTVKRGGRFVDSLSPLFPGYLFMGTTREPIPWTTINATSGVSKAVTPDGTYRPVSRQIIECLISRCDEGGVMQNMIDVASGDRVKIERGPFANFICNIDKISDNQRAWVLIDILQKQTRTEISMEYLSKSN